MRGWLREWWDELCKNGVRSLFTLPRQLWAVEQVLRNRDIDLQRAIEAGGELKLECDREKRLRERLERQLEEMRQGEVGAKALQVDELERLGMIAEQCGRVAESIGRVVRHGWDRHNSSAPRSNRTMLEREVGKLQAIIGFMIAQEDLRPRELLQWRDTEERSIPRFAHYQGFSAPAAARAQALDNETPQEMA
ncbi:MAG TPA: hypothetical protein VHB45_13060 [Alloacidobacterium sp.]|nr:hypothetical protein [Alloacidobacterium sp.]